MDSPEDTRSDTTEMSPLKILVVDDDSLNQRMMHTLLTREGHQVFLAANGLEAFDMVKFQKFDIVFMDLMMPIMDGMESSRRIREWEDGGQHTFIVALTASYLPEEGNRLFEAGIDNYISKPFQISHIERMLKYCEASRSISPSSGKVTFPQKLSSKEIFEIQNGIDGIENDWPPYRP